MKMNEKMNHCFESFPMFYMVAYFHDLIDNYKNFGKKFKQILMNKGIPLKIINHSVTKMQNIYMFNNIYDRDMDKLSYNLANETLLLVKYFFMLMNSYDEFIYEFTIQLYIYKVERYNRQEEERLIVLFQKQFENATLNSEIQIIQKIVENDNVITEVENPHEECCVCMETYEKHKYVMLNCLHELCITCCYDIIKTNKIKNECPICRAKINKITCTSIDQIRH
jgi:hypothetical protein